MKNESHLFAIGIESPAKLNTNIAIGFIQIGEFEERFELALDYWSVETYLKKWNEALRRLIEQRQPVALLTRMPKPQSRDYLRGWVFYPEGDLVLIQERVFLKPIENMTFDSHEHIINLEPRKTTTEDGNRISEWKTSARAIEAALKL